MLSLKKEKVILFKSFDEKYHAVSKFNVVTGNSIKSSSNVPTYTEVFADTLCNIAEDNEK